LNKTIFGEAHKMIKRTLGCLALFGLMASGSLLAHHSLAGVYEMHTEKEISGAVEKLQFVNPHGSLSLSVKNADGTSATWVFTLGSATGLAQRGVGKTGPNALHVGDKITIKYLPAKNGGTLGFLRAIIMPDGRNIVVSTGPTD
jgi:hypothetical protein